MSGPLSGLKVLSFCRALAGPYATQLLNDLGAEVIKLEDPRGGDNTRMGHPRLHDVSTYFLSVNRGKKSITLNLKNDQARKIVFALVAKVDVLVENYRPGVMKRLGLDYETVRKHNPKIIYASISGFGQTGPYSHRPAYDMLAQSMGGTVSLTGLPDPDTPPVRVGYSIGDMGASLYGAVAIQAALYEREQTGEGQWVDVSMLDSQVALCENAIVRYCATGDIPRPQGSRHPLSTPFQVFFTKDGAIALLAARDDHWVRFCNAAGRSEWIEDDRYGTNINRLRNYAEFESDMNALMRSKTSGEWEELFEAHEIMWGPVNNIEDVVNDPHINARDMILEVDHPRAGKHRVAGTPMKFSRTPCSIEKGAPELGAHNDEILSDWVGLSDEEIKQLRESGVI